MTREDRLWRSERSTSLRPERLGLTRRGSLTRARCRSSRRMRAQILAWQARSVSRHRREPIGKIRPCTEESIRRVGCLLANPCTLFIVLQALDQRHRGGRCADFALVNDIGKDVAGKDIARRRFRRCACRVDMRQVFGRFAVRPKLQALRPGVELRWRIGGRNRVLAFLQAGINEIAGRVRERRISRVISENDRRAKAADERDEIRRPELACRTSTTCRSARLPAFAGSNSRNFPKSAGSNFLVGANCQSSGPSRSPSSSTPESRKRWMLSPASANTRRLVAKRGP